MMRLSKPQKLVYDMDKALGSQSAIICGCMLIDGNISTDVAINAVNTMYKINDALRIYVTETSEGTKQSILEYSEKQVKVLRFKNKKALDLYANEYAKCPFNIYNELSEIAVVILENQYGILAKLHHIISDAWTMSLLGTQFNKIIKGESVKAYSYKMFLDSEDEYFQSERFEKDKTFFCKTLRNHTEPTYLSDKKTIGYGTKRQGFVLDEKTTKHIFAFAESNSSSAFTIIMTMFSIYLCKIKGKRELCIGTSFLNRRGIKEKNTVGMFVNTVPIPITIDTHTSFAENLRVVGETITKVMRHQKFNYNDILKMARKEFDFQETFFDLVINYQNASIEGNIDTTWYCCGVQSESLQIHIDDREHEGILKVNYDYQENKFSCNEIHYLHERIMFLLNNLLQSPEIPISEIDYIPDAEKNKILNEFNHFQRDFQDRRNVCSRIEYFAKIAPDNLAVVEKYKTVTYGTLNDYADKICQYIIEKEGSNQLVAISIPRGVELVATILGVLKSGAAYLPIDNTYPQERIAFMLSDSGAKLFLEENDVKQILRGNSSKRRTNQIESDENSLCYVIYTSGSTGKPKMVGINHGNLTHYINNLLELYGNNGINMPLFTNQCVDLTVTSIFLPLVTGGCIYTYNGDLKDDLQNIIDNKKLQIIKMTPTHLQLINKYVKHRKMDNIQHIILGGENLASVDVLNFLDVFGSHIQVHNEYGPTETTVGCGDYVFSQDDQNTEIVPIGHPFYNTKLYVLDEYERTLPIGCIGELCIGGKGVGVGYLNRKELTHEKFINNPYSDGAIYKTGDLAYWREDGNLVCVGRKDFQVKIHGLRIELGEIEIALSSIKGISQAVVNVIPKENNQYICAYYTSQEDVDIYFIKRELAKKLPRYMIPSVFQPIATIPLTASGKVDRKKLPIVDVQETGEEYLPPKTDLQKKMCKIVEKILDTKPYGIKHDFFENGGDSLSAIEFVANLESEGVLGVNIQMIFDYPTIEQLSCEIETKKKQEKIYKKQDFVDFHKYFDNNTLSKSYCVKKYKIVSVLLTGITGFLGAHILSELLEIEHCKIYCLVRSVSREDRRGRFPQILEYYFGDKYTNEIGKRIIPIIGDITDKNVYKELPEKVDLVIHAAATVKHYGHYDYFYRVNVLGTENMAAYALKTDAKFIYISTLSISENSSLSKRKKSNQLQYFAENSFYINQQLDNVYVRSKFEAECKVFQYMGKGLQANIIRIGNLTNRSTDYKFQYNYENNAFVARIRAIVEFGFFPDYLLPLYCEFSPVNEVAQAIIKIAQHFNDKYTVFHVNSNRNIRFDRMIEIMNLSNIPIKVISGKEFSGKLKAAMSSEQSYVYEAFMNDLDDDGKLAYDSNIHIQNDFTLSYLKQLGFEWSEIDYEYVKGYLDYFREIGYLKV